MKKYAHCYRSILIGVVLFCLRPVAWAQLPACDLMVELRQTEGDNGGGYVVRTQTPGVTLSRQTVTVRNGEKATVGTSRSIPMQWVQSVNAQQSSVKNAMIWLNAGQNIKVQPRWPGAQQPVTVELEVQAADVGVRTNADLPETTRNHWTTTISAPLGKWVTLASSGNRPQPGSYSSEDADGGEQLLQIRVTAP